VSDVGWELHLNNRYDINSIYSRIMDQELAANAGWRSYESLKSEKSWLSWSQDLRRDDMLIEAGLESHVCKHKLQNELFIGSKAMKLKKQDKHYVMIKLVDKNSIVWGLEPIWYKSKVIGLVRKGFYAYSFDQPMAYGYIYKNLLNCNSIPSDVEIEILGKLYNAKVSQVNHQ
jgi:glycine cleavage system aminomethyltransferase T